MPVGERLELELREQLLRLARSPRPSARRVCPTLDVKPDAMQARTVDG